MPKTINNQSRYLGIIDLLTSLLPDFLIKLIEKVNSFSIKNIFHKKSQLAADQVVAQSPHAKIPSHWDLENPGKAHAAELYILLNDNRDFLGADGSLIDSLPTEKSNEEKASKLKRAQALWAMSDTKNYIVLQRLQNLELYKILNTHPFLLQNGQLVDQLPMKELEDQNNRAIRQIEADFTRVVRTWHIQKYLAKEGLPVKPDQELNDLLSKYPDFVQGAKLVQEIPKKVFEAKQSKIKANMEVHLARATELWKSETSKTLEHFIDLPRNDVQFPPHFFVNTGTSTYMTTAWINERIGAH